MWSSWERLRLFLILGMNLQKLSLMKQAKIDPDSPGAKSEIKKWQIVWLVGMSGIVISAGW